MVTGGKQAEEGDSSFSQNSEFRLGVEQGAGVAGSPNTNHNPVVQGPGYGGGKKVWGKVVWRRGLKTIHVKAYWGIKHSQTPFISSPTRSEFSAMVYKIGMGQTNSSLKSKKRTPKYKDSL